MKAGPDIAMVASLVGDPARANMLTALMTGRALTASELAHQAGITPQTASSHLAKLEAGGLIAPQKQGRHRYFRLKDSEVAAASRDDGEPLLRVILELRPLERIDLVANENGHGHQDLHSSMRTEP